METLTQRTYQVLSQEHYLEISVQSFLRDRKASNLSPRTIAFYKEKLTKFIKYCNSQEIKYVTDITAGTIRDYMLIMSEERKNKKGNVHAFYRSIRALLYWYDREFEPDDWKNPIKKVKPPKQTQEIIDPVSIDTINQLLEVCGDDFEGIRFRAIQLVLLDTGARASEFLSLNLNDIRADGSIKIQHGKGDKDRLVFIGKKSRKALRKYLQHRNDDNPALWVTKNGNRLTYDGLRAIITRMSKKAGIFPPPAIHGYRRAFALSMLRSKTDIYSLQILMGHSSLTVLRRYLKQNDEDIRLAHMQGSPVDTHF